MFCYILEKFNNPFDILKANKNKTLRHFHKVIRILQMGRLFEEL